MSKSYIAAGLKLYEEKKDDPDITTLILDHAKKSYKKLSTRASSLGKLKRMIINTYYEDRDIPDAVQRMKLTSTQYTDINNDQAKALKKRGTKCITIDATAYINGFMHLLTSEDARESMVGLLAATGRRTEEIRRTAHFVEDGLYKVDFTGQLKIPEEEKRHGYSIPILAPTPVVIDALERLRDYQEGEPLKKPIHSTTLSNIIKRVSKFELNNPHQLRAIYAQIQYAFASKNPKFKTSYPEYVSKILGHHGTASVANYSCIKVTNLPDKPWVPPLNVELIELINPESAAQQRGAQRIVDYINMYGNMPSVNQMRKLGSSHGMLRAMYDNNVKLFSAYGYRF